MNKKFPDIHRTPRFVTVFTRPCHRPIFRTKRINSIICSPIFPLSMLILSSQLRPCLPCDPLPSGFPSKFKCYLSHFWLYHDASLRCECSKTSSDMGRKLRIYRISSRGLPTRGGLQAWVLGRGDASSPPQKPQVMNCYTKKQVDKNKYHLTTACVTQSPVEFEPRFQLRAW
jgi:hypothetical protein